MQLFLYLHVLLLSLLRRLSFTPAAAAPAQKESFLSSFSAAAAGRESLWNKTDHFGRHLKQPRLFLWLFAMKAAAVFSLSLFFQTFFLLFNFSLFLSLFEVAAAASAAASATLVFSAAAEILFKKTILDVGQPNLCPNSLSPLFFLSLSISFLLFSMDSRLSTRMFLTCFGRSVWSIACPGDT